LIPHVFHQIWLGPNPLPQEYAPYQRSWQRHHPGWELRFWTEESLPEALRRPEAADRLRAPAERADILRLELLWRFGGVYTDTDFECLRSIEPLLEGVEFFIGLAKPGRVNNALMGAAAGHPILDRALEELRPREQHGYDKAAAGPHFLDVLLAGHPNEVSFIEPDVFYPRTPAAAERAYAVHHEARSWKSREDLLTDAVRAEQRLALVQDELALMQKRYRVALEEAEALRQSARARARALRARRFLIRRIPRERIRYVLGTLRARAMRR
jgi:inositol phosphorylceramide mannosyltransferase catalytic subunit